MSLVTPRLVDAGSAARATLLAPVDLTAEGTLDATAALELREHIVQHLADGPRLFLLEISRVGHVTASGVAGTLELLHLARRHGGDLRPYGESVAVSHARHQTRLGTITRCYSTREQALVGGTDRTLPVAPRRSLFRKPRRRAGR